MPIPFTARGSGSSIVEAACAEIGADYEVRDLDVRAEEQRGDAYAALNPQRKLPTLEIEGGEIVTESVMRPTDRVNRRICRGAVRTAGAFGHSP
ncbi:MAG: glutathione S-transferase N-terminal domain-containing protein [Polyangiaceae bacterium]|nr:glutathione S-transferase N-terminal domain-containing protein [Polyangiaceae bacterium]